MRSYGLQITSHRERNLSLAIRHWSFQKGFALLEVFISVGIITLVGVISLVSFINSRNVRDLTTSAQNVLSVLRLAQSRTLAGEDNSQWGVHLEQSRFVLFRGAIFAGSTSTKEYLLPSNIEVVNVNLFGGGQDVVFKKVTGATSETGAFDVRVKGSAVNTFSITIDGSGKVYQTGIIPASAGSRMVDARHREFNLGWSIKNSTTLLLTFSDPPNPDVPNSVAMTPTAPRTTFDWTGTVTVGGQDQTLRIHATPISDTNTILHVDRDCRKNTKKVRVTIDTQDIATYEADCRTVMVGAFGGTMTEP